MTEPTTSSGGRPSVLRSTVFVSAGGVVAQALSLLTQVVIARQFGAGSGVDAYLAALVVPQYLVSVFVLSLSVSFVPVFIDRQHRHGDSEAWRLASTVLNALAAGLLLASAGGLAFRTPILALVAPGLTPAALRLADTTALILWPSIALSGALQLLLAIEQSAHRFVWPVLAGIAGPACNAALVVLLQARVGPISLGIGASAGIFVQLLLLSLSLRRGRYRPVCDLGVPGLSEMVRMAAPLTASAVLSSFVPVLERRLASSLGEGAISHLSYAYRIVTAQSLLLSTGVATVLFPGFVINSVTEDLTGLRKALSDGLRFLLVLLVPGAALTAALAEPLVAFAFQRGRFTAADTREVALLLQVYSVSLCAMALGSLVGRALYALRAMWVVGLFSVVEFSTYAVSAHYLSAAFGLAGLAAATVVYLWTGLLLCLVYLQLRLPGEGAATVLATLGRSVVAAALAAAVAAAAAQRFTGAPLRVLAGGASGVVAYVLLLWLSGSQELPELRVRLGSRRR